MTNSTKQPLEPLFDSEVPTQPALEQSLLAARALAKPHEDDEPVWCDSEAPTGVEAERPLFPPPPRSPRM